MIDYRSKADELAAQAGELGMDTGKVSRSQACSVVQYGYSLISFFPQVIRARREGVGRVGDNSIRVEYGDPEWMSKCINILSSGRTVECGAGVGMRDICQRISFQTVDYSLPFLVSKLRDPAYFNLSPDYQRADVWTHSQRCRFIGFLLENGRGPLVFMQETQDGIGPYEVIDGKQRLTSCMMFIDGDIPAELSDGRLVWWKDFNEVDRRIVPSIKCGIVRLQDKASVLRFYLKLNRGGTVHTDEELDRVRSMLKEIEDDQK